MTFFGEAVRMAARNLLSNKVRSSLTILGVVIGIGVVVAMTSMAASFEQSIVGEFDDISENTIFVTATISNPNSGPPDARGLGAIFTAHDQRQIAALPGVDHVAPAGDIFAATLSYDDRTVPQGALLARSPLDPEIADDAAYYLGQIFTSGQRELVLGWNVAMQLSGLSTAAESGPTVRPGDEVTISFLDGTNQTATISGILAASDSLIFETDRSVYAPIDPLYQNTVKSPNTGQPELVFGGFTVLASDSANTKTLTAAIRNYIENDSDAAALATDLEDLQFLVSTAADIQAGISQAFAQFTAFFAGIAGVSLFVAAIMIGTIMLISVTERTKEIGVMKAIGGRDRDILLMFLIESAFIGVIGAVIGVILGAVGGYGLVEGIFADQDIAYTIAYEWMIGGVVLGLFIGMVAGIAPARRATKIQPVEALSYD